MQGEGNARVKHHEAMEQKARHTDVIPRIMAHNTERDAIDNSEVKWKGDKEGTKIDILITENEGQIVE